MSQFILTNEGSKWAAQALAGSYTAPDVMYMIVSEGSYNSSAFNADTTVDAIKSAGGVRTDNVSIYVASNTPNNATISGVLACTNDMTGKKVIGVAVCCGDKVLTISELGSPVSCIANTSIVVSVPVNITAAK